MTTCFSCFFFNDTATTEIYTLSLHDALPIYSLRLVFPRITAPAARRRSTRKASRGAMEPSRDRKSTRLNSSHANISYAVFCLKKKKKNKTQYQPSQIFYLLVIRHDLYCDIHV